MQGRASLTEIKGAASTYSLAQRGPPARSPQGGLACPELSPLSAESSLKSDCLCCSFENGLFILISLYSALYIREETNCISDSGHKVNCWKKETSAERSFSPSTPASPSLQHGRVLKSICASWEKLTDAPATPKSHTILWVFRALHVL